MRGLPSLSMCRSMIWRITTGSFLATREYGIIIYIFLRIQFQQEGFILKTGTSSGGRKVYWLIFSLGLCRTVLDFVQIQTHKVAEQVQSSTSYIY